MLRNDGRFLGVRTNPCPCTDQIAGRVREFHGARSETRHAETGGGNVPGVFNRQAAHARS